MNDRFERQQDLVPTESLAAVNAQVIGVGAIGRQVALQLAALGICRLQLIDFDTVEPTNVTTQGYFGQTDLGLPKVVATERLIHQIDPDIHVIAVKDRYRPSHGVADAVFCCVDTISARQAIWRSTAGGCSFWCDGRMLGEVIRVLAVAGGLGREHYPSTLFAQSEAQPGRCTARSTIYSANVAAGLMLHQFTRWLRGLPIEPDQTLNLLSAELSVFAASEQP